MQDPEIVRLLFARDERALLEIPARYGREMKRVAMNILKNREDAEEVCNDALQAIWNAIPPENPRCFAAYLLRVVRNHAVMTLRRNTAAKRSGTQSLEALMEELGDVFVAAEDDGDDSREILAALTRFLETRDAADRKIFMRRYFYADSVADVAALMRMSSAAVTMRLSRMRKALSEQLKQAGIRL